MAKQLRLKDPDSWNPHPSETEPMFEGQDTHPLSREEMKAFYKRLDYPENFTDADDKIEAAFEAMAQTPTGRKEMRAIINAEPKDRVFKIENDDLSDKIGGKYTSDDDTVYISNKVLDKDPKEAGNTLLHELNHARHMSVNTTKLLADTETQALSAQLDTESKNKFGNNYDAVYNQNYQNNLKDWRSIAAGKKNPPKWAKDKAFKYQPSAAEKESGKNDPVREAKAREMYAREMASLETQAQFMEDFYSSKESLAKGYKSSEKFSYKELGFGNSYRKDELQASVVRPLVNAWGTKTARGEVYADQADDKTAIRELGKRNPALNTSVMLHRANDISKELTFHDPEIDTLTIDGALAAKAKLSAQEPKMDEEIGRQIDKDLMAVDKNTNLSEAEKNVAWFDVYASYAEYYPPERLQNRLFSCIKAHQQEHPELNADRKRMVEEYEKLTGHEIPLAANTETKSAEAPDLKKRFGEIGNPVNIEENGRDNSRLYESGGYAMA